MLNPGRASSMFKYKASHATNSINNLLKRLSVGLVVMADFWLQF